MRTIQKLTVLAALTSCLIPAAYAAKRFDSRRTIEPGLRIVQAPESMSRAMPLAASTSPRSLTMCDAWLTSDYEADRFSTNYLWCDFETLEIIGGFFTPSSKAIHANVVIRDNTGDLVLKLDGDLAAEPGVIGYVIAEVGVLPAGFYKATTRIHQGDRTVNQVVLFQVTAASDAACTPPAE